MDTKRGGAEGKTDVRRDASHRPGNFAPEEKGPCERGIVLWLSGSKGYHKRSSWVRNQHLFNFINRFQSVQTITLTKRRNWAILNWLDRWRTCPCDVLAFIPTWLPSRVLIFGAQDTTSSALSRILHLLSVNPEVQSKLRDEIELALKDSDERLDYDTVMALPWLDAVLKETLRLRVLISLFLTLLTLLTYVQ